MNQLAHSSSPYLRQHAQNPVDWREWTAATLEEAKQADRPILLSIGYAACHWCHVMAHESFEDPATAEVMNRLFVNIKLDREQRPDLDKVYQLAHQLLTQRGGGWPLTVFLDPQDLTPFFAGTYFPKEARYGLPGFVQVLTGAEQWFRSERAELRQQNQRLRTVLGEIYGGRGARRHSSLRVLDTALRAWTQNTDRQHGGFGGAPKFPHPVEWSLIAEVLRRPPAGVELPERSAAALLRTLDGMAEGGLYDHLGGGFCRYCVDARWEIPHFEKMLYDNALLLPLYAQAAADLGREDFAALSDATVAFLVRELRTGDGVFHASLDADSEGHEGRFYVWQQADLQRLPASERELASLAYGLDRSANFEGEAWHLTRRRSLAELAQRLQSSEVDLSQRLEQIRLTLLEARSSRVRPGTGDQVLLGWNALLISGLARSARALGRPDWLQFAVTAYAGLKARLQQADDRWNAHCGSAQMQPKATDQGAFLDDLAWLLQAQLDLLASAGSAALLAEAQAVAQTLLSQFGHPDGGFWFTPHNGETLPARPRSWTDEATPNGNGIALRCLQRLGRLLGDSTLLDAAAAGLHAAGADLERQPDSMASVLGALLESLDPAPELVWRGPVDVLPGWQDALAAAERRGLSVYRLIESVGAGYTGALAAMPATATGRVYWCNQGACEMPLETVADLLERLRVDQGAEVA